MNLLGNSVANATYATPSGHEVITTGAQAIGQARMLEDYQRQQSFAGAALVSHRDQPRPRPRRSWLSTDLPCGRGFVLPASRTGAAYQGTLYQSSLLLHTGGDGLQRSSMYVRL